ncbi:MAG: ABC transporter permease subunit [Tepidisphaeraceae bacterium]
MIIKSFRELWPTTVLLGIALLTVEIVLSYVLPTFQKEFSRQMMRLPFLQNMMRALLGSDISEGFGPEMFAAICWVHPVVLAIVWTGAIAGCTRLPAGEVDRGTIDVLLSMPVSRWQLFIIESLMWLVSMVVIIALGAAGNQIGSRGVADNLRADATCNFVIMVNMLALTMTVGAAAWLMSALSDRRGRAIMVVFALVLASFLTNYLAQFWEPAQKIEFLSILRYYRPLSILRHCTWPWRDLGVLAACSSALWLSAGVIFARRDLSTV